MSDRSLDFLFEACFEITHPWGFTLHSRYQVFMGDSLAAGFLDVFSFKPKGMHLTTFTS